MLLSMGTHNEFFRMNNDAEIHRRELREINIKIKKKTNFESIRDKKKGGKQVLFLGSTL